MKFLASIASTVLHTAAPRLFSVCVFTTRSTLRRAHVSVIKTLGPAGRIVLCAMYIPSQ